MGVVDPEGLLADEAQQRRGVGLPQDLGRLELLAGDQLGEDPGHGRHAGGRAGPRKM